MKSCPHCGHSRAAHAGRMSCALCGCTPSRQTFVQDALPFRSALTTRVLNDARKKVS